MYIIGVLGLHHLPRLWLVLLLLQFVFRDLPQESKVKILQVSSGGVAL